MLFLLCMRAAKQNKQIFLKLLAIYWFSQKLVAGS